MQRKVDARDHRALAEVRRVLSELFESGGTDWFPDEQQDLHAAIAIVGRLVDSVGKETAVEVLARRLAARGAARQAAGILDRLRGLRPGKGKRDDRERLDGLRRRDMEEAGLRLKDLQLRNRAPGGMTPEQRAEADRRHPDVPRSIRYTTDWDEVKRLMSGHPDVPESIRDITDWDEVKRLVGEKKGAA